MALLPEPTRPLDDQLTALREGAGARELPDRVLAVRGPDRHDWLNGQVTNEVKSLRPGQSRYTAIVQVKGKLLADAWVHARADELLLIVPPDTVDGLLQQFERHIVMEDVTVEPQPSLHVVAVQGPRARGAVGVGHAEVFEADRLGRGGVDWIVGRDAVPPALLEAIGRSEVVLVGEAAWEVARLEAGVPRWGVDFGSENYVQEANITARAVSFSKGCYTGQEVVCRLEMRGHVRRQLVSLVLDGEPPAPGTPVGGDLGTVTSAAFSPRLGRTVALAMVKWDVATSGGAVDVAGRPAQIVGRPVG
jgi:folate-binding protein YgfZ